MGFGHRVYKNVDPRATVLRTRAHEVLSTLGIGGEPLLQLAIELERIALEDEYFVARKLYPNVDFYSGIILRAMGIPPSLFTVLFAVARTVGWCAQWAEMMGDPSPEDRAPAAAVYGISAAPLRRHGAALASAPRRHDPKHGFGGGLRRGARRRPQLFRDGVGGGELRRPRRAVNEQLADRRRQGPPGDTPPEEAQARRHGRTAR